MHKDMTGWSVQHQGNTQHFSASPKGNDGKFNGQQVTPLKSRTAQKSATMTNNYYKQKRTHFSVL